MLIPVLALGQSRRAFTGAWIETCLWTQRRNVSFVAPSRARGLKLETKSTNPFHPGRAFTGAWIETQVEVKSDTPAICRAFTGAWIETYANTA